MGISFAITDPHGCLPLLKLLIDKCLLIASRCGEDGKHALFRFLGDYIDKGPQPKETVAFLREFEKKHRCVILRGNHEQMMIDAVTRNNTEDFDLNAGSIMSTIRSYGFRHVDLDDDLLEAMRADPVLMDDVAWFDTLPFWDEDEHRIFVHAGINPYQLDMTKQDKFWLLWQRHEFGFLMHRDFPFPKHVVHGHTPHNGHPDAPHNNRTNLDTDASKGGPLTAAVFIGEQAKPAGFVQAMWSEVGGFPG